MSEYSIKPGVVYLIQGGEFSGKYIRLDDDFNGSTGGIYMFVFSEESCTNLVAKYWAEGMENVDAQLRHAQVESLLHVPCTSPQKPGRSCSL